MENLNKKPNNENIQLCNNDFIGYYWNSFELSIEESNLQDEKTVFIFKKFLTGFFCLVVCFSFSTAALAVDDPSPEQPITLFLIEFKQKFSEKQLKKTASDLAVRMLMMALFSKLTQRLMFETSQKMLSETWRAGEQLELLEETRPKVEYHPQQVIFMPQKTLFEKLTQPAMLMKVGTSLFVVTTGTTIYYLYGQKITQVITNRLRSFFQQKSFTQPLVRKMIKEGSKKYADIFKLLPNLRGVIQNYIDTIEQLMVAIAENSPKQKGLKKKLHDFDKFFSKIILGGEVIGVKLPGLVTLYPEKSDPLNIILRQYGELFKTPAKALYYFKHTDDLELWNKLLYSDAILVNKLRSLYALLNLFKE